jgi:hypothetical protein
LNLILNAALAHLEKVNPWSVIPVRNDKRPVGSWTAWQSRAMTPSEAKTAFLSHRVKGLAVVCGTVSNLTVLDFEQRSLEIPEVQAILEFAKTVPRTRSGGGGVHLFFASSGERNKPLELNGVHVGDVRGEGGYIVLPPSAHPSGNTYQWELEPSNNLEPISEALQALLEQFNSKAQTTAKTTSTGKPAPQVLSKATSSNDAHRKYALTALENECENVESCTQGSRNHQLNKSAFALGQFIGAGVLSESEVSDQLENAALSCGLSITEAKATIQSGVRSGKLEPRDLTHIGQQIASDSWHSGISGTSWCATNRTPSSTKKSDYWHSGTLTRGGTPWR